MKLQSPTGRHNSYGHKDRSSLIDIFHLKRPLRHLTIRKVFGNDCRTFLWVSAVDASQLLIMYFPSFGGTFLSSGFACPTTTYCFGGTKARSFASIYGVYRALKSKAVISESQDRKTLGPVDCISHNLLFHILTEK